MYVIIVGGGKVGYYLSKILIEEGHEVLLVEKDKKKCDIIAEELGEIVYNGDGCEMQNLKEVGMERADVVVAVTGDDEDNLVVCQLAKKKFKVPRAIARINNPKNEEVFKILGINTTVSSTTIIYNLIEQEVDSGEVIPLMPLKRGSIEMVEIELKETSPLIGKKVKDLNINQDCILATVIRGEEVIFPRGDTVLQVGDTLLALTTPEKEKILKEVLVGE